MNPFKLVQPYFSRTRPLQILTLLVMSIQIVFQVLMIRGMQRLVDGLTRGAYAYIRAEIPGELITVAGYALISFVSQYFFRKFLYSSEFSLVSETAAPTYHGPACNCTGIPVFFRSRS